MNSKMRLWLFVVLACTHTAIYLVTQALPTLSDYRVSAWIYGISTYPALLMGSMGLPVIKPMQVAIFMPVIQPNLAGYCLCLAVWLVIYWCLAHLFAFKLARRRKG